MVIFKSSGYRVDTIVMLFYLYKILQRSLSFQWERMTLVLELSLCRHKYRPPTGLRLTRHLMSTLKRKALVKHYSLKEMGDSLWDELTFRPEQCWDKLPTLFTKKGSICGDSLRKDCKLPAQWLWVVNGTQKIAGPGNSWSHLKILECLVMSHQVSFFHVPSCLLSLVSQIFKQGSWGLNKSWI